MEPLGIKERDIFMAAVRFAKADRLAYLDTACGGDRALRGRVEVLLDAHDRAGSFLESPAPGVAATVGSPETTERPGTVIGPYKLLQEIGEGGMGMVYMAEQTHPVQRIVALKIIKPGMDSRQVIARFEAERQALALMDHPNIAKVLDAGTTGERRDVSPPVDRQADDVPLAGRPYFVMELVKGIPITKYCDDNHLTTRERLELFVPVCQAIQHAHQNGIIHRDIKPSNVLVTLYDGRPVPKVIDFGVAKATGQKLTERTLFTQHGTIVGTLEYMSPEQAEMSAQGVDTRSDIYSLGVLLYELLTGTTPFDREALRQADFDEVRRIIRDEEPPRPSLRVSTLRSSRSSTVSGQHIIDTHQLSHQLSSELDWIAMKCLEKDRTRRYESASALAVDIERHLNDEPVQACPPSAAYCIGKFVRRHKVAFAMAALVLLTVVLGSSISTWQAIRATRARDDERRTRQALDIAVKQARANEDTAKRQRARAEANFSKVIDSVTPLLLKLYSKELSEVPGTDQAQRALADRAFDVFQNLIDEQSSDPGVRLQSALAFIHLGYLLDTQRRSKEATEASVKAVAILDRLANEFPADPVCRFEQARTHDVLGLRLYSAGRLDEARTEFLRANESFERAVELKPDARTISNFAWFLARCPDASLRDASKAVHLAKVSVNLAPQETFCWRILGVARYRAADWKGTAIAMQRATELSTQWSYDYFFFAMAHYQLGNQQQALQIYERTADWTTQHYPEDHPESCEFRTEAEQTLGIVRQPVAGESHDD